MGDSIIREANIGDRMMPGPSRPMWVPDNPHNPVKRMAKELADKHNIDKHEIWRGLQNEIHARRLKEKLNMEYILEQARLLLNLKARVFSTG